MGMDTQIGINPSRRGARRLLLVVLAGIATFTIIIVAANIVAWSHADSVNAERLKVLETDGILRCHADSVSPWHEEEEINADLAGTTHGIGFGGQTPTSVDRFFSLNSANAANAMGAFAVCAQSSGWALIKQPGAALSGTKSFPGGWTAYLRIYVLEHSPIADQPLIQVDLITKPI
jgi:hypothetical protein